jgi:protein-tyrosine-phosphatase
MFLAVRPRGLLRPQASAGPNLHVDWRRYNQQILFVDGSDTIRGRLATGFLERCSEWNGAARILVAYHCGLNATPGSAIDMSATAALMGLAGGWKLRHSLFTGPRQVFEVEDIDRFDLIVALDGHVQAGVLSQLSEYRPDTPSSYVTRVCCLSDFLHYCEEEDLLRPGGSGLFDRQLRDLLRVHLPALRPVIGDAAPVLPAFMAPTIPTQSLADPPENWDRTMMMMAVCCVGLVRFLMDAWPDDLPEYDPL